MNEGWRGKEIKGVKERRSTADDNMRVWKSVKKKKMNVLNKSYKGR